MTNPATPPKGLDTSTKISSRGPTKYEPLNMSDESVYNLAQHYYTAQEIADRFKVNVTTMLALHGDAFHKGKDEAFNKPRMLLAKILSDFASPDINFSRMDVPTSTLLKAIELHAKKYEGLGQKTEVHHTGAVPYDKVESSPQIIERPEE